MNLYIISILKTSSIIFTTLEVLRDIKLRNDNVVIHDGLVFKYGDIMASKIELCDMTRVAYTTLWTCNRDTFGFK